MSSVVNAVEAAIGSAWDAIKTAVSDAWDVAVHDLIEPALALFYITDEDVIIVQKTSTLLYGDNTIDVVHQAGVKAVMSMVELGGSFFPYYAQHTLVTKAQIRTFYRLAENNFYIHGLPNIEIRGGDVDFDAIDVALDDALGFDANRLTVNTAFPSDEIYIQNELQVTPYFYKTWANTLTFGGDATWSISTYVYNSGPNNWTVNITHAIEPDNIITVPGFIKERTLIVTYHAVTDPSAEWFYWLYVLSSGTYPAIDPETSVLSNLEMLPVAIIRRLGEDVSVDTPTQEYLTTKKIIAALGLNIDEILESAGENSYYDNIEDLYINFAMNPTSTTEIVSKALWMTFHNIVVTNGVTSPTNEYTMTFEEQNVNNAAVWNDHTYTAGISGTLATGQEYEHEIVIIPYLFEVQAASTELYIRHQTSAGIYDELAISNLSGMSSIKKDGFHSMALNKLGDDNFTIPVSYFILSELKPTEQMQLYQSMLRLDSYAAQIIHLEFYETPGFLGFFEFAMVLLTIWSLGTATGFIAILKAIVYQYLIMELVMYVAELTGNAEFAAIIGLVAAIALNTGSTSAFDFTSAEGVLLASTNFADNLTVAYNVETQQLQEDLEDLNRTATERLDAIKEDTPEDSPITAEFLVALNKVDTTMYPAVKAQYDFDLLYNYDRIIKDYYEINLMTGVN